MRCPRGPPPSELGKALCVLQAQFGVVLRHRLVAGQFTFPAYFSAAKPRDGMKEDQAACETRQQVPEIVATSHMREFVVQNMGKFNGA
jgi:hypothetical protein